MKKTGLILITMLVSLNVGFSQTVDDALRYSQVFYGGTARFMSMGGAFTALGGDVSTLSQNPAGVGVFRASEISFTPQLFHSKTSAAFNGTSNTDYLYDFNLNQAGIVVNLLNDPGKSGLTTLNFGYSHNKTNNYNQTVIINGISNSSSMLDYFTDISSGYFHGELADNVADAFLAYDTWLIDTLSGSNLDYGTVYSNYGDDGSSIYGQKVRRLISNEGFTAENAFSFGGSYSDKIFFGATIGISQLRYKSHYEHQESTDYDLTSLFTDFDYTMHYEDKGTGYSLKLGAIIKPIESLRLGIAFHSPTYYKIDEYVYDNITSNFSDGGKYESSNSPVRFNYALSTPFRFLLGAAYQLQKVALFSADYEFVDYSTAKFSETGDGYDYGEKNMIIKNTLQSANNFRFGTEVRLNNLYLRGGYGHFGKAFKSSDLNADSDYSSFSLGTGFREQNLFVDFSFTRLINSEKYILYDSSLETSLAGFDNSKNMFNLTFGFKFN